MDKLEIIRKQHREFVKERDWEQFHSPKNLSMALAVEAAELMEVFMWLHPYQIQNLATTHPHLLQNAKKEIADVFLYLVRIADVLNIDLFEAAQEKSKKNAEKYPIT